MKALNEIMNNLDDNNMKAMEILRSVLKIQGDENEELIVGGVDLGILIDTAFDLLQKNNEIFNNSK
ncbi:MAG: hypothetical protein KIC52_10370 [Firmicutes bacterium]|nr:hypothetical protein [Bacillota bacterium]